MPLFLRFRARECVARAQVAIADEGVELAVILLRARLGQDLDASAARPRIFRGVRILIDPDLRDRRGTDVERADLHAVDDDRHAAAESRRIEEARGRRDQIAIEHGQPAEHLLIERHRVAVVRGARIDAGCGVADGDVLRNRGEVEDEFLR